MKVLSFPWTSTFCLRFIPQAMGSHLMHRTFLKVSQIGKQDGNLTDVTEEDNSENAAIHASEKKKPEIDLLRRPKADEAFM
ncbi:unnamed protein product [Haemonchus placei]|uniref:Secreted protein n=1 Tax=Haemonchus placei TaxID=6290 RepID=A0A0N4WC86_HAEPC|nr:unnamed protein product [Haemonchus placei]